MTTTLRQPDAPHLPVPADLVVDPATVPEDRRHLIPRFDAPVWPITFISDNPSDRERQIYWSTFPAELQDQFRHAAWALLNIPVSDQQLFRRGAGMRARLSIMRIYLTICQWRIFATWLDRRGITELAEVSAQVLTEYSLYLSKTRKVSRSTAVDYLVAVTRLHICAPHLPASSRIGVPPWDEAGLDDYLPAATASGENATEPISPATMGPLLVWALRFVEEFAVDVLAAHAEEQRLRQVTTRDHGRSLPSGTSSALASYLDDLIATGRPLPARPHRGPGFAPSAGIAYIAAITDSPHGQVQRVLQRPRWRGYLAAHPGPCPLDTPITGTIDGVPWLDSIDYYDVGHLVRHLTTACFVVIAYLTGMRPGEVLALDVGCCPDPEPGDTGDPSSGIRRHLIRGRHFKTARDDDGNHLSAGVTREAPWIAVPPVVTAIRMLERLVGPTGLLFPRDRGSRPRSLTFDTMGDRIEEFIGWVNNRTARPGRQDTIPADPHGRIGTSRFRRTLAWHIARRPGGLVALAVQYGHLRTLVSQGYSSRQRDGIHQLLDLETARAVADHLSEVHDALHQGEGVSGPAARRLIHAAKEEHHRFGGIIATPRQAKALLSDPALSVFENADAYLICNYDPNRALCNPNNGTSGPASTPSLDRCQATCPNIARTDTLNQQLRDQAERLRDQAGSALTPQPVADRLRHRATALIELADKHNRTRIALTDEDSA